jgi:hypothetical protein
LLGDPICFNLNKSIEQTYRGSPGMFERELKLNRAMLGFLKGLLQDVDDSLYTRPLTEGGHLQIALAIAVATASASASMASR